MAKLGYIHPRSVLLTECSYRGAVIRTEKCPTCKGNVQIKVFGCAIYKECTVGNYVTSIANCVTCRDYSPRPESENGRSR